MKRSVLCAAMMLMAGSLLAADSKDEVTGAAKKLAGKDNYSWKTTVEAPGGGGGGGGGRARPGPTEGKTQKDGVTFLSMTRGDTTTEAVLKGSKGAVKTPDGWKSLEEVRQAGGGGGGGGGQGRGGPGAVARMLQDYKTPAVQAEELVAKVSELKKTDDGYAGDLSEEGAKQLLIPFRGRAGGGGGPSVSNAKGSVTFWVKDGVLSKYEYKVQGTIDFNGNSNERQSTTTVEIKDVGTTRIEVPEEAKSKLSS